MSLPNPFNGLQHLGKVPAFLRQLRADIRILRTKDIPRTVPLPPRSAFDDDGLYVAAVSTIVREHRFAIVRQQVHKAHIRKTLWPRLGVCYMLLGPISFSLSILIVVFHAISFMHAPWIFWTIYQYLDLHSFLNRVLP